MNAILSRIAVAAALVTTAGAQAFTITPGTLIGVDASTGQLVEYTPAGVINETLNMVGGFSTPVGVEIIGGTLYMMGVGGDVHSVDLMTGATTSLFNALGNEGLGGRNGNLLALNYSTGTVREFSVAGALLNTFGVPGGGTGIDGYGAGFAVASYGDAQVRTYDAVGALLGAFATGLNAAEISGMGVDDADGSYWVSSGFGRDQIHHYSSGGVLLGSFAANSPWINGLDVIPDAQQVPAPTPLTLLGLCALGFALRGRLSRR